jgi:hypothetical protein
LKTELPDDATVEDLKVLIFSITSIVPDDMILRFG